jgi:hypothetical protein
MIQYAAATLKALPEVLELSRALKAITCEDGGESGQSCPFKRLIRAIRGRKMLRYRTNKMSSLRAVLPIFIAFFCFPFLHSIAAQTSPAGPLSPAPPSDQPTETAPVAKPRNAVLLGGKPNLSGTWNLNKDQSDDPQQLIEQDSKSTGGSNGGRVHGGWGGVGGTGGAGPRIGTGGSQGQTGGQGRGQREMTEDLSQITVEQTATSAKIIGPNGGVLGLYPAPSSNSTNAVNSSSTNTASNASSSSPASGSSKAPSDTSSGASGSSSGGSSTASNSSSDSNGGDRTDSHATPVAKWKGNQLVVVTSGAHGGTITRTYELSADSQQLDVTTTIDNSRLKHPVTINFVYDPAPSGG